MYDCIVYTERHAALAA